MERISFEPYWWEAARPLKLDAPTPFPTSVDIAIVGAGFTGLAAASTLAGAGKDTMVLDSRELGQGASTRNGGMAGSGTRLSLPLLTKRFGQSCAERLLKESFEAVEELESSLVAQGISCDFARTGRVIAAWTSADLEKLSRHAENVNRFRPGEAELVDAGDLRRQEVASTKYCGGIRLRSHGGLHPAKLHSGLLENARANGVRFAPSTPVLGIRNECDGFRLRLNGGSLRARKVLVATNGYTDRSQPWLAKRLLPIPSYLIASEPLPPDRLSELLPGTSMIVETRSRHCYYRRSPDGTRLVFGARASMRPVPLPRAASILRQIIEDLFPDTAHGLRYTHCWTGFVAFSGTQLPLITESKGITYVGAYCGNGVVLSNYLGRKAAFRMLGNPAGETVFAEIPIHAPIAFRLPNNLLQSAAEILIRGRDLVENIQNRRARSIR